MPPLPTTISYEHLLLRHTQNSTLYHTQNNAHLFETPTIALLFETPTIALLFDTPRITHSIIHPEKHTLHHP